MKINLLYEAFKNSTGVTTDTRKLKAGNIYIALRGENFNGNKFAKKAQENGASLVVVDDPEYCEEGMMLVENCLESLQALAATHRAHLDIPVIGITGSNGKTTTKELIREVLATKYKCYATEGNLNNHIGVPLSILRVTKDDEIAIIEMGANHVGEIEALCKISQPTHGVITNIGKAHLEGFGNLEGVIQGKTELYKWLASHEGHIFYNEESEVLKEHLPLGIGVHPYGENVEIVRSFPTIELIYKSELFESGLTGGYNGINIACALKVGEYFDVPKDLMKVAIRAYHSQMNRSQVMVIDHKTFIMDAYNANPISMAAALDNIESVIGDKVLILGDMLELGDYSTQEHQAIVDRLQSMQAKRIVIVGREFSKTKHQLEHYDDVNTLLEHFDMSVLDDSTILIKGSRGMTLEKVVKALE